LKIKKGETVVVSGAAGAVGSLAGQLARYLYGAGKVIGTAGGPEKCAYAKKQYAFDEVIDYKKFDTKEKIQAEFKRLAPNGVDAYFDNTGGHVTHALW
jgi:NADPH-dependent curcumin reductase CurA